MGFSDSEVEMKQVLNSGHKSSSNARFPAQYHCLPESVWVSDLMVQVESGLLTFLPMFYWPLSTCYLSLSHITMFRSASNEYPSSFHFAH